MTCRRPISRRAARWVSLAAFATAAACSSSPDASSATEPAEPPNASDAVADSTAPMTDPPPTVAPASAATAPATTPAPTPTNASTSSAPPATSADPTSVTTQTPPPTDGANPCVEDLTVRERAALVTWPAVESSDWGAATTTVADHGVGGVLLMEPSGWTADDITRNLAALESASRHGLIVATDEEGGAVQRLAVLGELPSQRQMSLDTVPGDARSLISEHGQRVRGVGVDMVLGPVVDVEPESGEVPLTPSRFFAGGPEVVAAYAAAYVSGWSDADLFAVLKHYPGHGAASGDTHDEAGVTPSLDELAARDLLPYVALSDRAAEAATSVMVGHLTVPGLTDGQPATRSRAAVDHLRDELGYGDALLMTDALGMAAVGLPEPEATVLALEAGIDVAIFTRTSQTGPVIDAIERAVADGRIPEDHLTDAAGKVMALLGRDGHTCDAPNV